MENEKRYSVRFPENILKEIKQVAREDERSVNGEIVWIVRTYLEMRRGKQDAALHKDQD